MMRALPMLALLASLASAAAPADDLADRARGILEKHEGAVVTIKAVIQEKYSGPDVGTEQQEYTLELLGTVIDPSGLTVATLSTLDPTSMYEAEMGENSEYKVDSQVVDVKMILTGGREVPATVALRDKDLDLAMIRPKQALSEPAPHVALSGDNDVRAFDPLVILSRLGKAANRASYGAISRVRTTVTRPRKYFVVGEDSYAMMGAPAFTLDGRPLGIVALRALQGDDSAHAFMGEGGAVLAVVVPGADVMDMAGQIDDAAPATP